MPFRSSYYLYRHRKVPWLEITKLREIQRQKLRTIIEYAYENVVYYRRLFDSVGVKPADIDSVEDLAKIPITTKSELQNLPPNEIIARNVPINKCKRIIISGPSGQPFEILFTRIDHSFLEMIWARSFLENGLKFRDKRVSIEYQLPYKSWVQQLGIWRKKLLPVQYDPISQVSILRKMNPDVLTGYPFDLEALARAIRTTGVEGILPRLVFSLGSFLGEEPRKLINSVFATKVFDYYATGELGCIAWECNKHSGYHINIDTFIVEFVKHGKSVSAGEKGEIVCTALHSYAMPLIRYKTGDLGVFSDEPCSCGRGLPVMSYREGCANTFIVTPIGKLVSPCLLVNILKIIPGIAQYKVVQESKEQLVVKLAKGRDFSHETVNRVQNGLKRALENIHIKIEVMDEIPADPPGKAWSIISKVPLEL